VVTQPRRTGGLFGALERLRSAGEDRDPAEAKRRATQVIARDEANRRLEQDATAAGVPERERKMIMHRNRPEQARSKVKAATQRHRGAHFRTALALSRPARRRQPRPRARRPGARRAGGVRSGQDPGDGGSEPPGIAGRHLTAGAPT